jgi:hypothetical protein
VRARTMKNLLPAFAVIALLTAAWLQPSPASAVPKMDVKVAVGVGSTTLVPRVPQLQLFDPDTGEPLPLVGGRSPGTFLNWGLQLGARVTAGKIFGEMAIGFSRFYFTVGEELETIAIAQGNPLPEGIIGQRARMNSLEIPLTAGYVPYKNPYFKLFLYGGWVRRYWREPEGFEVQTKGCPRVSLLDLRGGLSGWHPVRFGTPKFRFQLHHQHE